MRLGVAYKAARQIGRFSRTHPKSSLSLLLGRMVEDDTEITTRELLMISVFVWLSANAAAFNESALQLTMQRLKPQLEKFAVEYEQDPDGHTSERPFVGMVYSEGIWLGISNSREYIDTATGNTVERLPYHPVTTICCDLTAMLLQVQRLLAVESGDAPDTTESANA